MNFLAHAYFSFGDPQVLVGNMISDFVKGKKRYDYPQRIQHGIELHRRIDAFTDEHAATKKAKEIFRPDYRLYSGAIMDIVYDHFLANDVAIFPNDRLAGFCEEVYQQLDEHARWLPQPFFLMLPYMKRDNWLLHYKEQWGIERSMQGLVRRSAFLTDHKEAFNSFRTQYFYLQNCYELFADDVKSFAKTQFDLLNT